MSNLDAVEAITAELRTAVPELTLVIRPVRFAPQLFDVDVDAEGWGLTLSVTRQGRVRLMLDDYIVEDISSEDAVHFIKGLAMGSARVDVLKRRITGNLVQLTVPSADKPISVTRRYGKGLSSWEQSLVRRLG